MGWVQVFGRHLFVFSSHNSSVYHRDTESRTVTLGEVFQKHTLTLPAGLCTESAKAPRERIPSLLFPVLLLHDRAAVSPPGPPIGLEELWWWKRSGGGVGGWSDDERSGTLHFKTSRSDALRSPPLPVSEQRARRGKSFPPSHQKKEKKKSTDGPIVRAATR